MLFSLVPPATAGPLSIYTVNYPLKYFAERIAGEHANVVFPAPAEVDPAFWMPDAEIIVQYQQADVIFLNGADYAKWINKVSLPRSRMVDTSKDFEELYLTAADDTTHSHGLEGEHSHAGTYFTTWLDFSQAAKHAWVSKQALIVKSPAHKTDFQNNYQALEKDLLALDEKIQAIVSTSPDLPLLASHPVYQYLARRYGLDIKSVLWEPEMAPSEQQWAELQRMQPNHPATVMIWEGQPNEVTLNRLRSTSIESIVFDPCANTCESGDFLSAMQSNIENLKKLYP